MVVGTGFFTGRISTTGSVKFSGRMHDGTPFTVGSRLFWSKSGGNTIPLFVSLHRGKGVLAVTADVGSSVPNSLVPLGGFYIRPPAPGAVFLPDGVTLSITNFYGGRYSPPQAGQRAMNFRQSSNGAGILYVNPWGMELANQIVEGFNFGTNNKFAFTSQARKPALVLNSKTGLVTGSINTPDNVKRRISAVLTGGLLPIVFGYASGSTTTLQILGYQ